MTETKKTTVSEALKKARETATVNENTIAPDYQELYVNESAKNKALENKVAELEKLCKTYAEKERKATEALQRATLEYNARVKYMLDCVRHAHISMQFAIAASDDKGGNQ